MKEAKRLRIMIADLRQIIDHAQTVLEKVEQRLAELEKKKKT